MILKRTLDALASVLFAAPCRVCGDALQHAGRIPICAACLEGFERIANPLCQCCGRPFESPLAADAAQPLCRLCRIGFYGFDQARSFAVYNDALSEAIVLLKYDGVRPLGDWFAARLAEAIFRGTSGWRADVVVPVPLHPERLRERGYNQAELIARPLAKRLDLRLVEHLLARTKPRPPRLLLSRRERWESVRGAYVTRPGRKVDNLRILLVDDVMTTGATLDACARALKKAGAAAVFGITVARVRSWQVPPGVLSRGDLRRSSSKPDGRQEHP